MGEIFDPRGLKVIVRPDGTKEIIRLSEIERRQNDDFLAGFLAGIAFIAFLGTLATAVLSFVGAFGGRRC
jgi:hypothetical protein